VGRTRASSDQACVSASYPCASRALERAAGCLYHAPVCLRRLQEANSTATPQNPGSPSGQRMWQTLRMSHGHTQDRVESRGPDWGASSDQTGRVSRLACCVLMCVCCVLLCAAVCLLCDAVITVFIPNVCCCVMLCACCVMQSSLSSFILFAAVCYCVLLCAAVCYCVIQSSLSSFLLCAAVCYCVLLCVAVCCCVLLIAAVWCSHHCLHS
jgi:hypothetical protein